MTVTAPLKTWRVSPEVLATRGGACPHCSEAIVKGEHYIARVDGAPRREWMHAGCAAEYVRHLEHVAELRGETA